MEKRQKDILRPLVAGLRRLLAGTADGSRRGDLDRELERLGIAPDGSVAILDALPTLTPAERRARTVAVAELEGLADPKARTAARAAFIERAAYGWINRLLALRVLEARELIDGTLRANPDYDGLSEALYLLRQGEPGRASGPDGGWWAVIEDACAAQAAALPGLFALDADPRAGASRHAGDTLGDPAIALRPSTAALLDCVALLGDAPAGTPHGRAESVRAEMDAAFADPDAIGWAYQFYQEEAKAQVYLRLKAGKKVVTRDEIAAATQLFTEPYMVKWLLQNSLGRSYHEAYPDSALPAGWEYYIRPERLDPPAFSTLVGLSLLDPCMGSGHFLREAFDMFVAMYREQQPDLSAAEIADRILADHLHGIDIDPRAAGLAAFTLYARAWELLRDERRVRRQAGTGTYTPTAMNLATTPDRIAPGALARHLERHPEDRMLEALLQGVFAALEQADILGSLLRPREHLQAAVAKLRQLHQLQLGTVEEQELQAAIEAVAQSDPAHLEEMLLDRVAAGFAIEARGVGDVAAQLFGRAAERGVRLLQLLDRQYAVVVTNPPYMGSKNMDTTTLKYVERHYPSGKRDLYAAFILRNLELAGPGGRVAMVTQQSWMFLGSFAYLRAVPEEELAAVRAKGGFTGLLRETSLEAVAHLGRYAFSEIGNAVVAPVLFALRKQPLNHSERLWACRLTTPRPSEQQAALLRVAVADQASELVSAASQADLLSVPQAAIVYFLSKDLLSVLTSQTRLASVADVRQGLATANDHRFIRYTWEVSPSFKRWWTLSKGGGYCKWFGQNWYHTDWEQSGARMAATGKSVIRNPMYYETPGWSYSRICRGNLALRKLDIPGCIGDKGPGIYSGVPWIPAIAHSHLVSYLLRAVSPQLAFEVQTISQVPLPTTSIHALSLLVEGCEHLKACLVATDVTERNFSCLRTPNDFDLTAMWLHTLEGSSERIVCSAYGLSEASLSQVFQDTGTPVGWYPLIPGYQTPPPLPDALTLPDELRTALESHLATLPRALAVPNTAVSRQRPGTAVPQPFPLGVHDHPATLPPIAAAALPATTLPDTAVFVRCHDTAVSGLDLAPTAVSTPSILKARLRALYEAGPGASTADDATDEVSGEDDAEIPVAGAYLPIPTETFLEELSQRLQIHPISVYWLLQEIRAEGARCKPEEQRMLEDRLSVLVLRLLGHRWPRQLEAGEPVPEWADRDGIIPLLPGAGEATLAERLRERLRAEDGDLGAQQAEALLAELTGQDLETWLRRAFFPRHVRQFKYRPIAWHLASVP